MRAAFHRWARPVIWGLLLAIPSVTLCAQEDRSAPPPAPSLAATEATSTLPSEPQMQQSTLPLDYVIGPEDVLEVSVFDVPDLQKLTVRVTNDGTIALPLLGDVRAAGLTPQQLRDNLEKAWGRSYLENPHVMVFVKEFHAQPVSVVGAVEKPGLYQLTGPRTLIEVISLAGGFAQARSAPGRYLYVSRKGGFENFVPAEGLRLVASDKVEVSIDRLLYSRDNAVNITIKPQDIITVTKADIVYVVGAVKKAGGFVLGDQHQVTVLQALALAEGLGPNAAKRDARIIHTADDGKKSEVPIDLEKVLKGKGTDPQLSANDILFVPDSTAKATLKRSIDTAVAMATGLVIWRL